MHKKSKIFIFFFLLLISTIFIQTSSAKYVKEEIFTVAKLDIDTCRPNIELIDIVSSNTNYPTYANKSHSITGHIKITEKNIIRNDLSPDTIQIRVADTVLTPEFKNFSLVFDNTIEKIYEFTITNIIGDGSLALVIPEGTVEDKCGLINNTHYLPTSIFIDNTPPTATLVETTTAERQIKT